MCPEQRYQKLMAVHKELIKHEDLRMTEKQVRQLEQRTQELDGFHPVHLQGLMQCRESGADFLCILIAFIYAVFSGGCPCDMAATFFGGLLLTRKREVFIPLQLVSLSAALHVSVQSFQLARLISQVFYLGSWE